MLVAIPVYHSFVNSWTKNLHISCKMKKSEIIHEEHTVMLYRNAKSHALLLISEARKYVELYFHPSGHTKYVVTRITSKQRRMKLLVIKSMNITTLYL